MDRNASAALRPLASGIALAIGFLLAEPAAAQGAPVQLPGQTPQDVDPARRVPTVQPAQIDPVTLTVDAACPFAGTGEITLTRIDIIGATLVPEGELQHAVAELVGRPSDAGVLCSARDRVARVYAERGEALARVDLPDQTIRGGVLTLRVTEGRIVSATVANGAGQGPSAALAQGYLDRARTTGATPWRDVERAFVLIREIPGAEPRYTLRRANDGSADGLDVGVAFAPRRRFDFTLAAQNLGSEELGREGASLRIDANSLTGLGERTSLVLFSSTGGRQQVAQLIGEVRLGASGWLALGDVAIGRSEPGGGLAPLELEGRSTVARLGARYGLVKRRDAALDAGVRLDYIDQQNDLGFLRGFGLGAIPLSDERLAVLALEATGRWQPRGMAQVGTVYGLELRQGLDALGASRAGDPLLSRSEARTDFTALRVNAGARWGAGTGAARPYLQVAASGQWADEPLPAYEEFQVGNYTVGRGFDPGAASGDRAIALQLEGGVDVARGNAVVSLFGFADGARLWNLDTDGYDATPWSVGAGVRLRGRAGRLDLTYASPRNAPLPGLPREDARLLATYTYTFSIR